MSLFSSRREKRLWLWAIAAVIAIYSTLGLAGKLSVLLRDNGMLGDSMVFSTFLIFAVIVAQGLRVRPRGIEIAVMLGLPIVYIMLVLRMGIPPTERTHLVEYSVVTLLIHAALIERADQGRRVPSPALLALGLTILIGWIDEGIQFLLPNRVYDIRDVGFNSLAALMAVGASSLLTWVRRRMAR